MYAINCRPQKLKDVVGATLAKKIVARVVTNPSLAPTSFVLEGPFGTGKSTVSRIFAKALNCSSVTGDCCNVCEDCLAHERYYFEYDSAIIGNVENIRSLRSSFFAVNEKFFRVVAFDEAQSISPQAQGALLKLLEEAPKRTFFLFPTTDPDRLLDTIKSRSLSIPFFLLKSSELNQLIDQTLGTDGLPKLISDEVREIMIRRSRGHARDLMQQLSLLAILGADEYLGHSPLLDGLFVELFSDEVLNNPSRLEEVLVQIVKFPSAHIAVDLQQFLLNLSRGNQFSKTYEILLQFYFKFGRELSNSLDYYLFLKHVASMLQKKESKNPVRDRFNK